MNAVIRSIDPMQESIEIDEGESARAALRVFNDMVDGGCSLADTLTAVYVAGQESITGKLKRRPKKPSTPPCPYEQIVALYHQLLPNLPEVRLMDDKRKAGMRQRWKWIFSSLLDGKPRATTKDEALHWLSRYFERAKASDFLMGRTKRSAEHANWRPDIDFILSSAGLKQIIERTEANAE